MLVWALDPLTTVLIREKGQKTFRRESEIGSISQERGELAVVTRSQKSKDRALFFSLVSPKLGPVPGT